MSKRRAYPRYLVRIYTCLHVKPPDNGAPQVVYSSNRTSYFPQILLVVCAVLRGSRLSWLELCYFITMRGPVAQRIRHLTTNQGIPGSNPGRVVAKTLRQEAAPQVITSCARPYGNRNRPTGNLFSWSGKNRK